MTNAYLCYLVVTCYYYFTGCDTTSPVHGKGNSLEFETRRQGGHLRNMVAIINLKTNQFNFNGKRSVTNIYPLICADCNNFGFENFGSTLVKNRNFKYDNSLKK